MALIEPDVPKVLIVDDDPCVARLLTEQCALKGFRVEAATCGYQALSKADTFKPDLLVVDVHMPDIDGLWVCANLLNRQRNALHVVVISGYSSPGIAERCHGSATRYINKGKHFWDEFWTAVAEIFPGRGIIARQTEASNMEIRTRPRVLLVDDDASVNRFVASRLYDLGIEPSVASDAKMGFFKARREDPTVIIVDYVMPNGDAEYLLTRLRHCPETSRIPVIVHSTHALDGPIALRLRREIDGHPGASQIVRKSLHAQELFEALKRFCCFVTDAAHSREQLN